MAAVAQTGRSALQRHLRGRLDRLAAAGVRFLGAFPLVLVYLAVLAALGVVLPAPTLAAAAVTVTGALAQIAGTVLLLAAFEARSFAVGTAFMKTETIQTAAVGGVIGDDVSGRDVLGMLVSLAGTMAMTLARGTPMALAGATYGIASGFAFTVSALAYRWAALALPEGGPAGRAAVTLAVALGVQTALLLAWFAWRDRAGLRALAAAWRPGLAVGMCGATASIGWFTAFTLQSAAIVKAVGQIELVLSFAVSFLIFGERPTPREVLGALALVAGILLVLI